MINLLLLFISTFALADQCEKVSTDPIALNTFGKTKACLSAIANAPGSPEFSKMYFQKMDAKEHFVFFCHTDDKTHSRILFLEDDGIQTLKLPIYYYMSGIDHTDLPRNILHFKNQNKDFYIQYEYADVANVVTSDKLPALAKDMMVSMSRIQNEYIKKYEAWLKTENKESAIKLAAPDEAEMKILMTCLEKKQQEVVNLYLQSKFLPKIPAYGTMVNDSRNRENMSSADKAKYERPWSDIESEFMDELKKSYPVCDGIVGEQSVKQAFEKSFGKNKVPYEVLRRYFYP